MSQKHRNRRIKKNLSLEHLEDRMLLSGNVTVLQNFPNGQLIIAGDNGNNALAIGQTNNLGVPTLTVVGSSITTPLVMGNVTAIDAVAGGVQNFALSSISSIVITEGNGTNFISLSGFSIPGNITINVGTGVDTILLNNISANVGAITITGAGASQDTVSETNVIAGLNSIKTGTRAATITQNNVTKGFDFITAGPANNTITITNSRFAPAPRLYAIGQLNLVAGNGNNTVTLDNISVGPANITLGNGNNNFKFDDSTIQQANITIGTETSGAVGSNVVDISRDVVTGAFLDLSVLNQAGVNGVLANGANDRAVLEHHPPRALDLEEEELDRVGEPEELFRLAGERSRLDLDSGRIGDEGVAVDPAGHVLALQARFEPAEVDRHQIPWARRKAARHSPDRCRAPP